MEANTQVEAKITQLKATLLQDLLKCFIEQKCLCKKDVLENLNGLTDERDNWTTQTALHFFNSKMYIFNIFIRQIKLIFFHFTKAKGNQKNSQLKSFKSIPAMKFHLERGEKHK